MDSLQVIASPRRLRILELAWDREITAGDIARESDLTWPAVSQHIKVLKVAGFLTERRDGTHRLYRADKERLGPLRVVVESYWNDRLATLKDLAETEGRGHST